MPDFVIVGTDGTEHHFPDGMDPKAAIQVVKNSELKAANAKPIHEPTSFWAGAAKGANDYATEVGQGMFESAAHPQTAGDFAGLLLPTSIGTGGVLKGLRSASEAKPPINQAVEALTPSRSTVVKGLRAVSEPTKVWRKSVGYIADKIEQGGIVGERVPKMSEVYSEKPAPPRDPNAPRPRMEPTKISDVVSSKPAPPRDPNIVAPRPEPTKISDVVSERPAPDWRPAAEKTMADVYSEGPAPDWKPEAERTMADVYSEKPAPPRQPTVPTGPDAMSPRVAGKAPTLDDVLRDSLLSVSSNDPAAASTLGETPMTGGMQKPKIPAIKGKVKRAGAPGGYTTDIPARGEAPAPVGGEDAVAAEGVTRSPSDRRLSPTGKVDRITETSQGADQLEELLSALHPDEAIPRVNPEGHGSMSPVEPDLAARAKELRRLKGARDAGAEMFPELSEAERTARIRELAPGPSRTPLEAEDRINAATRKAKGDDLPSVLLAMLTGGGLVSRQTTSNQGGLQ